jgi:hypothetical protein
MGKKPCWFASGEPSENSMNWLRKSAPIRMCLFKYVSSTASASGLRGDIASSCGTSSSVAYAERMPPPVGFTWQSMQFCS